VHFLPHADSMTNNSDDYQYIVYVSLTAKNPVDLSHSGEHRYI
jgi:hypothetical protein